MEEYLKPQIRFAHLFKAPERRDILDLIQKQADRNIAMYGLVSEADREEDREEANESGSEGDKA